MEYKGNPPYAQAPPYPQDNYVMPVPPPQYSAMPPPPGVQMPYPSQMPHPAQVPVQGHTDNLLRIMPVGPEPQTITCPSCRASVRTVMRYENTTRTHCIALLLCLFICWPCVCLPYCMDSCRNGNHYCPNCNAYIGTYES